MSTAAPVPTTDGADGTAPVAADALHSGGGPEPQPRPMTAQLAAELLGTFVLVFTGCGAAVLASTATSGGAAVGIGYLGIALAFGLSVLAMATAFGGVSGGHFNPAVTVGLAVARRFAWRDAPGYMASQVAGAIAAAAVLFAVAHGKAGYSARASGFATDGYGSRSPGGYSLLACAVAEVVLTAIFVAVVLAATALEANAALASIAIGLALTLVHLVGIPVTGTSVNPARSIGPALFAGTGPLSQLWLFIAAPLAGGALAGLLVPAVLGRHAAQSD